MPPSDAPEREHPAGNATAGNATADAPGDLLLIGRVLKAHANGGEVKVAPETDDPARFEPLGTLYLGRAPERATPHRIESVRHQTTKRGPLVLVKLEGVDDRDAAEALRRRQVYAAEDDLPPLGEDEAFIHDLVGLAVLDEEGTRLGTVEGVEQTPAHDVFVVAREGGGEPALIPAVEEFVREVDFESDRLVVHPIEGMV